MGAAGDCASGGRPLDYGSNLAWADLTAGWHRQADWGPTECCLSARGPHGLWEMADLAEDRG
jgi:hypothetical protein